MKAYLLMLTAPMLAVSCLAQEAVLEPVKATPVEKISCSNANVNWGSCVAKSVENRLFVVYFRGFTSGAHVSGDQLQWTAKYSSNDAEAPIALGAPTEETPYFFIGNIPRGEWVALGGAAEPLLALVFVAPKDTKELLLTDPAGGSHKVSVVSDWSPPKESFSNSLRFSANQFLGPKPDDLWTTK